MPNHALDAAPGMRDARPMARSALLSCGLLAGALMLAGCGSADPREPLDGGLLLQLDASAEEADIRAAQSSWRRERGGWHMSMGHVEEMLPLETISGVWVTGFEETSFFPSATAMPDRNDPHRYMQEIEVDHAKVEAFTGRPDPKGGYRAILLTFEGRRTRYPEFVGCDGTRSYGFVVYRVHSARDLGEMHDPDRPPVPKPDAPRGTPFKRSGEGGVTAERETEAMKRCGFAD